jgi:hypothetical protein
MVMLKVSASSNFHYFVSGDKPKILIHCGTHGDEGDVTQYVVKALKKYEKALPPFLFIPEVSPTAIDSCLRNNAFGNDMNRKFFSDSLDQEVKINIEVIKDKKFDLFLSFHEDPHGPDYYLYDVGYRKTENEIAKKHNQLLKSRGIGLLNGVDDSEDEDLGFVFEEGYNKMVFQQSDKDDGTISAWVLNRHIAEEYLLPEIPGKAGSETKEFIVDSFLSEVVLKMF